MGVRTDLSVLVTGANGGLGLETCKHLMRDGATRIVLACRTLAKAQAARATLTEAIPKAGTELQCAGGFDMNAPDAIRDAVAELDSSRPLDTVFLQAGGVTYGEAWKTVAYGGHQVERTVFQNALGGHVTLAALVKNGLLVEGTRVVIAGGEGARGIPNLIESPHFGSARALRDYLTVADNSLPYVAMNAMGVSKFASALWAQQAHVHYRGHLDVLWFSPGFTAGTRGLAGIGRFKQFVFENFGFPVMVLLGRAQTAARGGRKNADCLQGKLGVGGDIIGAPEGTALGNLVDQRPMNPGLTNPALRAELWRLFEQLTGATPTY